MMISHAKCGAGGSQTRSDRCRRPRRRVILRPVSLGVHPSMIVTAIAGTKRTINSLSFPIANMTVLKREGYCKVTD